MKRSIRKQLKDAGFTGQVYFRKHSEFGTPDTYGPALHRRWIDPAYEMEEILYSQERDGFTRAVIYLEPKSYYHYAEILRNPKHIWTEGEINGLRKGLGYCTSWSRVASNALIEDIQLMDFPSFHITKEQTKFGIEWLKRTQFKLNGELRASAFVGNREASIILNFARFEFIGLEFANYNSYNETYQTIAPIYRVLDKRGNSFEYRVSPMGGFAAKYEVVA